MKKDYLTVKERFLILSIYIFSLYSISVLVTNTWLPAGGGRNLWFISSIGYLTFKLLSVPFFTTPSDSLATSISTLLLLWSLDLTEINFVFSFNIFKRSAIVFSLIILVSSSILILIRNKKSENLVLNKLCYLITVNLAKGELLFTPLVLISIFGFHQSNLTNMLILGSVWIIIVVIEPIELIFKIKNELKDLEINNKKVVGLIKRVDSPNIIKVSLKSDSNWSADKVNITYLANSKAAYVLPLFTQVINENIIGTGLYYEDKNIDESNLSKNVVYTSKNKIVRKKLIEKIMGLDIEADLIGFVAEESSISYLKFEVASERKLKEGIIVFCIQDNQKIYYQILDAQTAEEKFLSNPRGTHIVTAAQLGTLNSEKGFKKYEWLPDMNSPIFIPEEKISAKGNGNELVLGKLPGSNIDVAANFDDLLEYHTAILGVTGTGKTELAFDIIKYGLEKKTKVFCVDFTGDYKQRLSDYDPEILSLNPESSKKMEKLLYNIEIGAYSAQKEKAEFNNFIEEIRPEIEGNIEDFLSTPEASLGIFELPDIAATKATLRATELYLSEIFNWARENRKEKNILVVLEEAHTVIPETFAHNYDKAETNLVISRISQIALQGRKYGVGLLIISQRTALVSKTILSQCNTYFTFSLVDQTSLKYLSSVYSSDHVDSIPNLAFLETLAYGKGIKSEKPITIKIPFDDQKQKESESLN